MMIRLYRLLLSLYPAGCRSTFGPEMTFVFEQALADAWRRGVLRGAVFCIREFTGLAIGALRARARRSGAWEQPSTSIGPAFDDVPAFYTCDDYAPRRSALIQGGILSLAFFGMVTAAFEYGVNHRIFRLPPGAPGAAPDAGQSQLIQTSDTGFVAFGKSLLSSRDGALGLVLGTHPATASIGMKPGAARQSEVWSNMVWLLKVRPDLRLLARGAFQGQAAGGRYTLADYAAVYFQSNPVLMALDADHDEVISAAEIANAAAVLKRLDENHDGRLTAEECGGSVPPGADLQSRRLANLAYMRFHPVLAALDADHDGEISAGEMENAPAALRTLDRNHDGKLTIDEILPKAGVMVR